MGPHYPYGTALSIWDRIILMGPHYPYRASYSHSFSCLEVLLHRRRNDWSTSLLGYRVYQHSALPDFTETRWEIEYSSYSLLLFTLVTSDDLSECLTLSLSNSRSPLRSIGCLVSPGKASAWQSYSILLDTLLLREISQVRRWVFWSLSTLRTLSSSGCSQGHDEIIRKGDIAAFDFVHYFLKWVYIRDEKRHKKSVLPERAKP